MSGSLLKLSTSCSPDREPSQNVARKKSKALTLIGRNASVEAEDLVARVHLEQVLEERKNLETDREDKDFVALAVVPKIEKLLHDLRNS